MTHSSSPRGSAVPERAGRAGPLAWIIGGIAVTTAIALVILWPGEADTELAAGLAAPTDRAEVTEVAEGPCPPPQPGNCARASIRLDSGADDGAAASLALGATTLDPGLAVGDAIRVSRAAPAPGANSPSYTFVDFERRSPMLWLAIAFAALVIAFGRLRGALSLVGLAASLGIVVLFVIPAILDGTSPLAVAIVGSLAVMLLTISLAHGLGPKSLAAMLGTTVSLVLVAVLALAFTEITHLTGLASEESALLQINEVDVSFEGLLLAGMVIAALGVLDDVTVSQASTVLALRRANPGLGAGELYRRAIDVGRDHVSATVNTLVLAYVGASLPVLLLFGSGELGFVDAVNVELVAQEVVGTLVGSIGLIAAVPITTALAAKLAPASGEAGDEHGQHH